MFQRNCSSTSSATDGSATDGSATDGSATDGSATDDALPGSNTDYPRILGTYSRGLPGPQVLVTGGVHGNEPAGIVAVQRVLAALEGKSAPLRGSLTGIAGNRAGLAKGARYLTRDLNRRWVLDDMVALLSRDRAEDTAEDREQRELLELFAPLLATTEEPLVFIDLHSTSGDGAPFSCMADVIRNRKIAFSLGVPVVLGLEEVIDGSMLGFLCDLGHIGVAIEGGQHDHPGTADNHESAIWIALVAAGCLDAAHVPDLADHRRRLREVTRGLPQVIEIRHRHVVHDENEPFTMLPGFTNFQPVREQQVVASDAQGEVRTPEAALMMLPRYQPQGEDGYFLARQVSRFWLALSAGLRRSRIDRLVHWLPGVRRDPARHDHMVLDRERPRAVDVFHLMGYRHRRDEGDGFVFTRRRPDATGLESMPSAMQELLDAAAAATNEA